MREELPSEALAAQWRPAKTNDANSTPSGSEQGCGGLCNVHGLNASLAMRGNTTGTRSGRTATLRTLRTHGVRHGV